jgi:uncharacterized protein (DUF433 family)
MPVSIDPEVVCSPRICGGRARVQGTRIAVWMLEAARRQGAQDGDILQMYPWLRPMHLQEAWKYVEAHREEIEKDLAEQESP